MPRDRTGGRQPQWVAEAMRLRASGLGLGSIAVRIGKDLRIVAYHLAYCCGDDRAREDYAGLWERSGQREVL